jgi:hypothetical protein
MTPILHPCQEYLMPEPAQDEPAIRGLATAYSDAVNRGSAEDMAATYCGDGVLTTFGAPDIVGHAAAGGGGSIGRELPT